MEKKLPPEMTTVLIECHFAYLCTTDRSNQPHIAPMFYLFDEETSNLHVITSTESKKMRNIQDNPNVCLTIDIRDPTNPFNNRGVMVQGKATVCYSVDSSSAIKDEKIIQAFERFEKKYPILKKEHPITEEYKKFSQNLVRITPTKMVYWRGPKFITVKFNKHKKKQL